MYVRNRMTANPFTVTPETTVAEAIKLMMNHKIKRLPVVKDGKLAGIVTKEKLLEVSPSTATTLSIFEVNYLLANTKVSKVMTKEVFIVEPGNLLEEALVLMREKDIGGLPVVENGKLVGIITEADVFDAFIEILGFRDKGSRIVVEVGEDKPGILARIAGIVAESNVIISHVAVFRNEIILRLNTTNVQAIAEAIRNNGNNVLSVTINE